MSDPITVSPKQAQRLLGIGNTYFYKILKQKKLDSVLVGKRRLVNYASLKRFANGEA